MQRAVRSPTLFAIFVLCSSAWLDTSTASPAVEPGPSRPPAPSPRASALFEKHVEAGTLFTSAAAREFQRKGWGRDYRQLVRERWKGRDRDGVSLALKRLPDHTYRIGQEFDCRAFLTNEGDSAKKLNTGGTCRMTHALEILVVHPDGRLGLGRCRGAVGGPHCFCEQAHETLQSEETVKLATGFASQAAAAWTIKEPGEYVVIGSYALASDNGNPAARVYSRPLVVDVEKRQRR